MVTVLGLTCTHSNSAKLRRNELKWIFFATQRTDPTTKTNPKNKALASRAANRWEPHPNWMGLVVDPPLNIIVWATGQWCKSSFPQTKANSTVFRCAARDPSWFELCWSEIPELTARPKKQVSLSSAQNFGNVRSGARQIPTVYDQRAPMWFLVFFWKTLEYRTSRGVAKTGELYEKYLESNKVDPGTWAPFQPCPSIACVNQNPSQEETLSQARFFWHCWCGKAFDPCPMDCV